MEVLIWWNFQRWRQIRSGRSALGLAKPWPGYTIGTSQKGQCGSSSWCLWFVFHYLGPIFIPHEDIQVVTSYHQASVARIGFPLCLPGFTLMKRLLLVLSLETLLLHHSCSQIILKLLLCSWHLAHCHLRNSGRNFFRYISLTYILFNTSKP